MGETAAGIGGIQAGPFACSVCRPLGTTPGVAKSLLKPALLRDPVRACSIDKAIVSYNPQLLPHPGTANPRWGVLRRGSGLPGQSRGRSAPEQTPQTAVVSCSLLNRTAGLQVQVTATLSCSITRCRRHNTWHCSKRHRRSRSSCCTAHLPRIRGVTGGCQCAQRCEPTPEIQFCRCTHHPLQRSGKP